MRPYATSVFGIELLVYEALERERERKRERERSY